MFSGIGGIFSSIKLLAIAAMVIAIIGYLATTRLDAQRAASAEGEIEELVRVNQVNQRKLQITTELHQKSQETRERLESEKEQARVEADTAKQRIKQIEASGVGQQCRIDCTLPTELQD